MAMRYTNQRNDTANVPKGLVLHKYDAEALLIIEDKIGLKKITEGHGSFLSGKNQNNLKFDKLNILPLICYEIIFPSLIQKKK